MSGRGLRCCLWVLTILSIMLVFGGGIVRRAAGQAGADPSLVGQWGPLIDVSMEGIHMHVLPTGKVLVYGYHTDEEGRDTPRVWDPATGIMTLVDVPENVFCSGHSFLADGRLFVTGGHIIDGVGIVDTFLFDPFANTWTRSPDMNMGRWYPTNTTLSNGDVLILEGTGEGAVADDLPQVYNPETNSLRDLSSARIALWKWYPHNFLAPNGKVFNAGPLPQTRYLDTSGTGNWTFVDNTRSGWFREEGTAVMYDVGKVLIMGGGDPPTSSAEVIDLNQPAPSWRMVSPMAFPRRNANSTLLPDGKVLVTGGSSCAGYDNAACPVLPAEMWNPALEKFDTMASAASFRGYHSTAVLLPDARVLIAGGDQAPRAHQIYSPPYLFKGPRPTIGSAPANVLYGQTFFVQTPDAANIAAVNWIRLGSVTHAFNQNQRINRLTFTQNANGLNVVAPSDRNLTPPGHYMLFLLDANGVPSVSSIIRIDRPTSEDTLPPVIWNVGTSAVVATSATVAWSTGEPADSQVDFGQTLAYGSSTSLDPALRTSHSQVISGLIPSTTYHYRVRSTDAAGHSTVSPDFTFTTAKTADTVVWTALVNVAASGNSLRKTAGCDGCGDAGAVSTQSIASGDGYVEFTASETNTYRGAGLSNGNTDTSLGDIDFAILLKPNGQLEVRENAVWKAGTGYTTGSVLRVAVVGGRVRYSRDGVVFYTSAALPNYPLVLDTSLWTPNATITNAVISNATTVVDTTAPAISNVAASGITSSSATINWTTDEPADSQVEYGATLVYGSFTSLNPASTISHSQLLSNLSPSTAYHYRVWSKDAAGNEAVSGDSTFTTTSATGPQDFWMALVNVAATGNSLRKTSGCDGCADSGAVSIQGIASGDGYVEFTASETNTYRGAGLGNNNTNPSLGDIDFAILLKSNGSAEVREKAVWKADAQYVSGTVFRVAVVGARVQYSKDGTVFYTSAVPPTYPLQLDTSLWSLNATITNAVISNATTVVDTTAPAISNIASAGITSSGATINWNTDEPADSQVEYGTTTAYGFSTSVNPIQLSAHSVPLSSLSPSTVYHYRVRSKDAAGNLAVSGDSSFTTTAATGPQDFWTALVNVVATGNSLRKTGACDGCNDAGAVSIQSINSGDGYVEFTTLETNTYRGAGLGNNNTNTSLGDIDFAILMKSNATAEVREKGIWKADVQYGPGTVFRVAVVAGRVQYSKDGTVFYTSAALPTYPLQLDTTLWSLNATISNAVIFGGVPAN